MQREDQLRALREIEDQLRASPHEASARLGAAFGMPTTPLQQATQREQLAQEHAYNSSFVAWRDQQLANNPDVARHYPAVVSVLEHEAFVSSGDAAHDLSRAYQFARYAAAHGIDPGALASHVDEAAHEMRLKEHVAQFRDTIGAQAFEASRHDAAALLESGQADGLADAFAKANEVRIRRAQRAKGVKASGTVSSRSDGGRESLDSIISGALGKAGLYE
jgi:hypothetical protein